MLRDDRIDSDRLSFWREVTEETLEEDRAELRKVHASDSGPEEGLGDFEAHNLTGSALDALRLDYAAGTPVSDVARRLDGILGDFTLALAVRERTRRGAPGFLADVAERRLMFAAADLALVATSFGRADVATAVLEHPAVAAVPARVLDVLAMIHGVSRSLSEGDEMSVVFDPWVKVAGADGPLRQEEFERYVTGWRAHNEKAQSLAPVNDAFTGAWAFEAVVLAQTLGLDDGPVREVPEYPRDLADYAREVGLPQIGADVTLPGPWKPVAPPKVLEPEVRRETVSVTDEPTLADLAALLTPVGGEHLEASDVDALVEVAVDASAMVTVDARGLDPSETAELLQLTCRDLGLPAPGRGPSRLPKDPAKALPKFDAWLAKVGVRLLSPAMDADDLAFFPVLAEDYETFGGRTVAGLRLRTVEQVADEEA